MGEGPQDVAGLDVAAGGQGQPFEADHRVTAPVGEPVIAGDHGAHFVAGGTRTCRIPTRPVGVMMNWSAASTSSAATPSRAAG